MVDRERLKHFRARFGLNLDDADFPRFQKRVVQAAAESLAPLLAKDRETLEREFAFRNGSDFVLGDSWGSHLNIVHGVVDELKGAKTFSNLIERVQSILWSLEALGYLEDRPRYSDRDAAGLLFTRMLNAAIDLSPGIDLRLQATAGRAELAPAGVPMLDDVVDKVTQWLARYPDTQKEFRQAQTILAGKNRSQYRQAQDSLRFGLEKLLKLLLGNNTRLEDQGKPLKEWLTARGVHDALRDVAVQILGVMTRQYQNTAVKHDNTVAGGVSKTWTDFEVEYVLYQYATLVHLLIEAAEVPS